jgi:hypothetical protein
MEMTQCLLDTDLSCAGILISASFPLPIMIELLTKVQVGIDLVPRDFSVPHGSGRMKAEEVYTMGPEEDSDVFGVASCGDATTGDEEDKGVDERGLIKENRDGEDK